MKISRLLFLIAGIMMASYSFAARMTVYNETGSALNISVWKQGQLKSFRDVVLDAAAEGQESKESFNTGNMWSGFKKITWGEFPLGGEIRPIYEALIPSSGTMLTGSVTLFPNGECSVNFDENGASSSKVHAVTVHRIN